MSFTDFPHNLNIPNKYYSHRPCLHIINLHFRVQIISYLDEVLALLLARWSLSCLCLLTKQAGRSHRGELMMKRKMCMMMVMRTITMVKEVILGCPFDDRDDDDWWKFASHKNIDLWIKHICHKMKKQNEKSGTKGSVMNLNNQSSKLIDKGQMQVKRSTSFICHQTHHPGIE